MNKSAFILYTNIQNFPSIKWRSIHPWAKNFVLKVGKKKITSEISIDAVWRSFVWLLKGPVKTDEFLKNRRPVKSFGWDLYRKSDTSTSDILWVRLPISINLVSTF